MNWTLHFNPQVQADATRLAAAGLRPHAEHLLEILKNDPLQPHPPCEKLQGNLEGAFSRRINIQHRLVYQVFEKLRIVRVVRMWGHGN